MTKKVLRKICMAFRNEYAGLLPWGPQHLFKFNYRLTTQPYEATY